MQNISLSVPVLWHACSLAFSRISISRLRALVGMVIGVALFAALAMKWPLFVATAPPAGVSIWVADRDADQLVGLDRNLFVQKTIMLRSPVRLAPKTGGLWAVSAAKGSPLGQHKLKRLAATGSLVAVAGGSDLGPILDLETGPFGGALCIEMGLLGQPTQILKVGAFTGATLAAFAQHPGALSVLGQLDIGGGAPPAAFERVLVGDELGFVTRYDSNGIVLAQAAVGGQISDLGLGPNGLIFALDLTGGGRILCLDAALTPIWTVNTGIATESFSVVPGEERLWLADSTGPLARRYGPGGALELEVQLPASDASAVLAQRGGGVLVGVPGAIIRIGPAGTILPGQGGFNYLVDITGQK